MRIEELVLEGFKSYPVRTSITGWDPSFNAITGLNGSGKSNILDAICFVLGITNMSQMRAQNQQDLIYKRGQAGVTKASVTIVFDNSDRATSPVGLENCKQITVTRQIALPNISKYLLNGHKSTQQNVQTLFQGVQLNINNPNFLIMQGRITKVLNMRPQEILGMVEEAAGTRMFEDRKDKAKKTMGKKEKRVENITSLLNEEITPKLDTLREEKRSFLQWQKTCSELERMGRLLRAWEWTEAHARVSKKEAEIAANEKQISKLQKDKEKISREITAAEEQHKDVVAQRDKELKKGGKFKKLEDAVTEKGKELVKLRTQHEIKSSTVADEEKKIVDLQTELKDLKSSTEEKRKEFAKLDLSYTKIRDAHTTLQTSLSTAEELLQTLLTGVSSGSSGHTGGGYMGQIADARARLAQATSEEEQNKTQLSMSETELKGFENRWKEVEREAADGKKNLQNMKAEVEKCKQQVGKSGWSEEKEQQGQAALNGAKQEVKRLTEVRDNKKQQLSSLSFDFTSPTLDFDRSKVKGLVASLVSLRQSNYDKATALEITAGAKLYNVVVQDERVGKDLLEKGQLKKRVTLIPLNKVDPRVFPRDKIQAASRLAKDKVRTALSLVGYPDEIEKAMCYVFGDTFICDDAEIAKLVTFSPEVKGARSVTLAGDVYDPSGTLSGGSAPSSSGILIKVQDLLDIERQLGEAQGKVNLLLQEEERTCEQRDKWRSLVKDLDIKEHSMKLLEEQVGGSNATRLGTDIDNLKKTIADLKVAIKSSRDKQAAAKDEIKKLQKDMDEFKDNKEGKIEQLKANISEQKAALQKHAVHVKTSHKETQTATLELQQMDTDVRTADQAIEDAKVGVIKLKKELKNLSDDVAICEEQHTQAETNLREEKATLSQFDDELKELEAVIQKKKDDCSNMEVEVGKLQHGSKTLEKDKTAAVNLVASLEKQHEWIAEESRSFGKPGTPYDFNSVDISEIRDKAKDLEAAQKGMKKKVNTKVINMIDGVEKREAGLKKMLAQVLKDKETIEATIEELDRYKRDALIKTWEKVNGDFGGIFAELLPGNFAKLEPPEGQDLTQGLEVKVRLGSVWKQSLTELSGGQRSLIALSLIMSLLQFKPAPMYILDEIDAALDLSHTQHIGQLFRTRFKGSQFIVVSLKEGLFTNANVLFRTRFRDGTSIVERTAQRSTSTLYN